MTQPSSDDYFSSQFAAERFMAIFRNEGPDKTVELCNTAWDLGLTVVEVPIQTPDALPSLEAAVRAGRERGVDVGAGTITTVDQLREAQRLGAAFTVAPGVSTAVIGESLERGLPHLPGVATSSDITVALSFGLSWLKAFPAAQLGSAWIRAQRGPFPAVSFVATGGMDASNAKEFLDSGVRVVAIGSALSDPDQLKKLAALR